MIKVILPLLFIMVLSQGTMKIEEEPLLQINWSGLLQCLKEAAPAPVAKDVVELIRLIKAKQ